MEAVPTDRDRPPGQNQVQKLLNSRPNAPSGTVSRQRRATTSGSKLGSKVWRTLCRSPRDMTFAPRPPVRQNPRKTSSSGLPERPTALRTRFTTRSVSGPSTGLPAKLELEPPGVAKPAS